MYLSSTRKYDGSERAAAAGDVSLAYFGGQARSFLFFWPYLMARRKYICQPNGELVVGPKGHAVLPLHPAPLVSLLV